MPLPLRPLPVLFLVLLLAPVGSAKVVEVEASGLEADALASQGTSPVTHVWDGEGTRFRLHAAGARVVEVTETIDTTVRTPLGGAGATAPRTSTQETGWADVLWDGSLLDGGFLLVTSTAPGASTHASGTEVRLAASPRAVEEAGPVPREHRQAWQPSVEGLLLAESRDATVRVSGDFVLRLWLGWVGGAAAEGRAWFESEARQEDTDPAGVTYASHKVFLVLHVTNGTLTLRAPETAFVRTYLDGDSLLTPHGGRLLGVSGRVGDEVVQGTVPLEDGAPLLASAVGDGLHVRTPPRTTAPSGLVAALPEPATSVPLLALALAAVAGLALFVRSRRPTSVQMLLDRMDRRQYRRVVRHAGAVQRRTRSEAVSVMKVVSLLALGRAGRALRYLEGLPADLRPTDGMDPFLRAHALNEMGEPDEARRFLTTALGENPGLVVELAALPRLRALLPDEPPAGAYA